jgi:putative tryptophan/tyrosine transport system substrate-binding protein
MGSVAAAKALWDAFALRASSVKTAWLLSLIFALMSVPHFDAIAEAKPDRTYRVGFMLEVRSAPTPYVVWFVGRMRELGYEEGRNLFIEYKFGGYEAVKAKQNADELARLPLDVVVIAGNQQPYLVKDSFGSTPIVVASCDPVERLKSGLARPEGTITGSACMSAELSPKKLELLKLLVPDARRVGALYADTLPGPELAVELMRAAAPKLGVDLHAVPVTPATKFDEIANALDSIAPQALIVYPEETVGRHYKELRNYVTQRRLPAMYGFRQSVDAGGLVSYGSNLQDLMRRAASLTDRVLNGAKPGDLPIELPTRFELIVNLKAAREIGLEIPVEVLDRADELIE